MKALNVFLFSNTKEHMLLTVRIECSFEIQSIARKYGHGYGNEQKKQSFRCHLLLSTVCRSFAGVTRSMIDTDNWTPSLKRRLNFILSQNNECSHLLRTHVKWFWILFHELHLFFFPIQLHIPRGYSKKFRGRVPPEVLRLIRLYTIFDVISSMRRSVSSPDEERREEKRREKKSWKYDAQRSISFLLRNTTPFTYLKWQISLLFHILQLVKSLFFHLPKA